MNGFIIFVLTSMCFECIIRAEETYPLSNYGQITTQEDDDHPVVERSAWSVQSRIPMTTEHDDDDDESRKSKFGKFKVKKKLQKYLLPLLLAYKLKFFTLIPVLIGGLVLLTGATGLAGFFFALFAAVMGLKTSVHH